MSPPVPRQGGSRLSRYRAERLLHKDFAVLRSKVLAVVRSRLRSEGIVLDPADLEACYAEAWHGLYATVLAGEAVENPSAWLVLVTFRRAIDEHRSASRAGVVEGGEMGSFPSWVDAGARDLAAELDDRTRLRQVFEALRTRLSARECEAASLCYLQGLSRAEAAERMGVSDARMRKLMEGAGPGRPGVASKVGRLLDTIKAGGWCEQQSSLMRAFAFGVLDPQGERHALAVAHCRECPACRAHVASLRGLASVLPLPLLSRLVLAGGKGTVAAAGTRALDVDTSSGGPSATVGRRPSAAGAPARRLASSVSRVGGKLGAGGWGGFAGSLTVKLAVTAVILLGAGYATLGSHAHASPGGPPVPAALAPLPVAASVLSQAPFGVSYARVHVDAERDRRDRRRSVAARPRHPRAHTAAPTAEVAAPEFSPERVGSAGPSSVTSAASSPARSVAGSGGEFGFE
ncbi:MAG TPA: sigma-70 family RNA polymerase sigma factor [Solirubrobacteraceae bacterium]